MEVAVCICTADRPAGLSRLLAALAVAELSPDGVVTRIVIVDNRSGGSTAGIVAAAARRVTGLGWELVEEPQPGIPAARNRAVSTAIAAGAEWIAFLDDDDVPEPDWLDRLIRRQRESGADLVFGASRPSPATTLPAWARPLRYFGTSRLSEINAYGVPAPASTSNVLIGAHVVERVAMDGAPFRAMFAGSGGEDTDLFIRAVAAGCRFATAPHSLVNRHWEEARLSFAGLFRRAMKHGATRQRLREAHRPDEGRRRRRAVRHALEGLVACIAAVLRPRLWVGRSLDLAERIGELRTAWGIEPGYYSPPNRRRNR